jgi:hypothetical protein
MVGFANVPEILDFLTGRKRGFRDRIQVMVHDYLAVCPSYNLLNVKGGYCGVPGFGRCRTCLPQNPFAAAEVRDMPIETWRRAWGRLLRVADRVVHFSEASREVVSRAFPDLGDNTVVKPHRVNWAVRRKLNVFPKKPGEPLRIGIVGSIGDAKGAAMVVKASRIMARQKLDAELVVLGRLGRAARSDRLRVLGPYKTRDLAKLIERERIHVFWVASIWPETYSYVTTELMRLNVPIACFNLGAPPERVATISARPGDREDRRGPGDPGAHGARRARQCPGPGPSQPGQAERSRWAAPVARARPRRGGRQVRLCSAALLRPDEMATADRLAVAAGVASLDLMENAGRAVAEAVLERWTRARSWCSPVPATMAATGSWPPGTLAQAGWPVRVALAGRRESFKGDAAVMAERWTGEVEAGRAGCAARS